MIKDISLNLNIKWNVTLIKVVFLLSFLSYEIHLYKNYYRILNIFVLFVILFSIFINIYLNSKHSHFFFVNFYKHKIFHLLLLGITLNTFIASLKNSNVTLINFLMAILTFINIYIYFHFLSSVFYKDLYLNIKMILNIITIFSLISIIIKINGNFFYYVETHYNRISSIFFDPNYFGVIASIGAILSLQTKENTLINFPINIMGVYLSGSRSALIALIIVLIIEFNLYSNLTLKKLIYSIILILTTIVSSYFLYMTDYFRIYQGLSGREHLWYLTIEIIAKNPLIGYGPGSLPNLLKEAGAINISSHNSFIDFIATYGVLNFIIYIYIIIKSIFYGYKYKVTKEILMISIYLFIVSNFIAINLGGVGILSLLYSLTLGMCYHYKELKTYFD